MKNLKTFTVSKNKQKGGWDLRENGTKRLVHHFLTKENAKKGGVVKRLLGKPGGSVHFEKEHGGFDEERTYPRKKRSPQIKGLVCQKISFLIENGRELLKLYTAIGKLECCGSGIKSTSFSSR